MPQKGFCKNPKCTTKIKVMAHKGDEYCSQACRKKCEPVVGDQHGLNLVQLTREEQRLIKEVRKHG